ncbi:hypothetical protein E2C01_068933 [Portunus trituberculatus]|uniref:RNA-directed DNA polymerase from mobile element jockey n=1 Tax=Portunus trituberculatus TaxID=210409 RepID=A0A5B7HQ54_PORTR|nr:hypothetical protein [Portunus trituberculatus]
MLAQTVSDLMYENVVNCKSKMCGADEEDNVGRWERLLEDKDDVRVWKAVNWKGEYGYDQGKDEQCPSDEEFKKHFEAVLNPPDVVNLSHTDVTTITSVPVLDEPILPHQVSDQIKNMKVDNACGPDGLSPGVLSLLPAHWILTLPTLLNNVFLSGVYPDSWRRAKVFTKYKRGNMCDTNNYRGISVINAIAK